MCCCAVDFGYSLSIGVGLVRLRSPNCFGSRESGELDWQIGVCYGCTGSEIAEIAHRKEKFFAVFGSQAGRPRAVLS